MQYFDKARMEITQPSSGHVSNGLLVVELVSGQRKPGDDAWDNVHLPAAGTIAVAGDPYEVNQYAPTCYAFQQLATINDPASQRDGERMGQSIGTVMYQFPPAHQLQLGYRDDLARAYAAETRIVYYEHVTHLCQRPLRRTLVALPHGRRWPRAAVTLLGQRRDGGLIGRAGLWRPAREQHRR